MSGFAAKACLELGLQQEKSVNDFDESPADLDFVQDLFLCVYNLDKRCSFYANLPWTLVDKDINDNIFDPVCRSFHMFEAFIGIDSSNLAA